MLFACSHDAATHAPIHAVPLASLHLACPASCPLCPAPQVWLHELLPTGLESNPQAVRRTSADLESALKARQPGGRLRLCSTLVDSDMRREMYQAAFLEDSELADPAHQGSTAGSAAAGAGTGAEAAAVTEGGAPEAAAAAANAGASAAASGNPGGSDSGPDLHTRRGARLMRLESVTEEYSERELRKKALHSGQWLGRFSLPFIGTLFHLERGQAPLAPTSRGADQQETEQAPAVLPLLFCP